MPFNSEDGMKPDANMLSEAAAERLRIAFPGKGMTIGDRFLRFYISDLDPDPTNDTQGDQILRSKYSDAFPKPARYSSESDDSSASLQSTPRTLPSERSPATTIESTPTTPDDEYKTITPMVTPNTTLKRKHTATDLDSDPTTSPTPQVKKPMVQKDKLPQPRIRAQDIQEYAANVLDATIFAGPSELIRYRNLHRLMLKYSNQYIYNEVNKYHPGELTRKQLGDRIELARSYVARTDGRSEAEIRAEVKESRQENGITARAPFVSCPLCSSTHHIMEDSRTAEERNAHDSIQGFSAINHRRLHTNEHGVHLYRALVLPLMSREAWDKMPIGLETSKVLDWMEDDEEPEFPEDDSVVPSIPPTDVMIFQRGPSSLTDEELYDLTIRYSRHDIVELFKAVHPQVPISLVMSNHRLYHKTHGFYARLGERQGKTREEVMEQHRMEKKLWRLAHPDAKRRMKKSATAKTKSVEHESEQFESALYENHKEKTPGLMEPEQSKFGSPHFVQSGASPSPEFWTPTKRGNVEVLEFRPKKQCQAKSWNWELWRMT